MKEERFQKHLSEKDALLCVCVAEAGTEMLKETDTLAVSDYTGHERPLLLQQRKPHPLSHLQSLFLSRRAEV